MGEIMLAKKMDIFKPDELESTNRAMASFSRDEREKICEELHKRVVEEYPTMANKGVYFCKKSSNEVSYDFSLTHEGKPNSEGIMKPGGFSDKYLEAVERNAEVNHWRRYWNLVSIAEENNETPLFDYHVKYIHWYAFHYLPFDKSLQYLLYVRTKLLIDMMELPEQLVNNVDKQLSMFINKLKDIHDARNSI